MKIYKPGDFLKLDQSFFDVISPDIYHGIILYAYQQPDTSGRYNIGTAYSVLTENDILVIDFAYPVAIQSIGNTIGINVAHEWIDTYGTVLCNMNIEPTPFTVEVEHSELIRVYRILVSSGYFNYTHACPEGTNNVKTV